jgi:hypothetical protein
MRHRTHPNGLLVHDVRASSIADVSEIFDVQSSNPISGLRISPQSPLSRNYRLCHLDLVGITVARRVRSVGKLEELASTR